MPFVEPQKKTCPICEKVFVGASNQTYCSGKCRDVANVRKFREKEKQAETEETKRLQALANLENNSEIVRQKKEIVLCPDGVFRSRYDYNKMYGVSSQCGYFHKIWEKLGNQLKKDFWERLEARFVLTHEELLHANSCSKCEELVSRYEGFRKQKERFNVSVAHEIIGQTQREKLEHPNKTWVFNLKPTEQPEPTPLRPDQKQIEQPKQFKNRTIFDNEQQENEEDNEENKNSKSDKSNNESSESNESNEQTEQ
jgi:predicted nucleic acid-binding Zn ribbon protein